MSCSKNAFSCPCKHAVEGILDHLGIQEALSNYKVVDDYLAHSKFVASSSPKEKIRTPWGMNEGAKANRLVYSLVDQEITAEDIA